MIKILHHNSCSKSRGVLEYLQENNIPYKMIDLINHPLSETELRDVLIKLQMKAQDLVRKNEELFLEKYSGKDFSQEEWIHILTENLSLLQRPILMKENKAIIGRPLEKVKDFIRQ